MIVVACHVLSYPCMTAIPRGMTVIPLVGRLVASTTVARPVGCRQWAVGVAWHDVVCCPRVVRFGRLFAYPTGHGSVPYYFGTLAVLGVVVGSVFACCACCLVSCIACHAPTAIVRQCVACETCFRGLCHVMNLTHTTTPTLRQGLRVCTASCCYLQRAALLLVRRTIASIAACSPAM